MSYGEGIKIDLPKPPRKLTRLIIRTVDTQEVEHISKGDVIVYGQVIHGVDKNASSTLYHNGFI